MSFQMNFLRSEVEKFKNLLTVNYRWRKSRVHIVLHKIESSIKISGISCEIEGMSVEESD